MNKKQKEILIEIDELQKKIKQLQTEYTSISFSNSKDNASKYARQKEIDKLNGEWARTNLKVGDIVKVKGSRTTSPREIEKITHGYIIADHVKIFKTGQIFREHKITDHGFDKITNVYRDGKFVTIRSLREADESRT